jgi:hypothetical protein
MWTKKSSPEEELKGREYALAEGWMTHVFRVGDEKAWDKALKRHGEVEKARCTS